MIVVVFALLIVSGAAAGSESAPDALAILGAASYWDGGSVGAELADSTGCSVKFCIDRRGMIRGHLWLDAIYPTHEGARIAGPRERDRILTLLRAIQREYEARVRSHTENADADSTVRESIESVKWLIMEVEDPTIGSFSTLPGYGEPDSSSVRRDEESR